MTPSAPSGERSRDATTEVYESWLDSLGRLNKPRFFAHLLERAGVELDRALFPLLVWIGVHGRVGVTQLAEAVGSDHSTVSRQLARLEELRFIERTRSEADARVREAVLTSTGRHVIDEVNAARRRVLEEALADWSEEDKHQFAVLTDRFGASMRAYAAEHANATVDPPAS